MPFSSRVRVGSEQQETDRIMHIKSKKGDKIIGDSNDNSISNDEQTKKDGSAEFMKKKPSQKRSKSKKVNKKATMVIPAV